MSGSFGSRALPEHHKRKLGSQGRTDPKFSQPGLWVLFQPWNIGAGLEMQQWVQNALPGAAPGGRALSRCSWRQSSFPLLPAWFPPSTQQRNTTKQIWITYKLFYSSFLFNERKTKNRKAYSSVLRMPFPFPSFGFKLIFELHWNTSRK